MAFVGAFTRRPDADAKVRGAARYVADLDVPDAWLGGTVRADVARGRLVRIDRDPGFDFTRVVVVTAADIPGRNVVALIADDQPLLAQDAIEPRRGLCRRAEAQGVPAPRRETAASGGSRRARASASSPRRDRQSTCACRLRRALGRCERTSAGSSQGSDQTTQLALVNTSRDVRPPDSSRRRVEPESPLPWDHGRLLRINSARLHSLTAPH